jgi:hypothetical protein
LEKFGVRIIRYTDLEIKRSMNDVLRSLGNIISDIEINNAKTSPLPPSKGESS